MKRHIEAFTDETFDLCIVGGGITGAGAALDAASRGWRVALIERGDFASGASSASSKLIHGGLRYLEHGHFGLVYEALQERGLLLRNAPHLVEPLAFAIPFYAGQRIAPWKWRLGLTLYDFLAGRANIVRSRCLARRDLQAKLIGLRGQGLAGGALYYDALMDDARLCLAVLQTAARHGAVVANYVAAFAFEKAHGAITGVWAEDQPSGRRFLIRSRTVLNAAGPGADAVCRLAGDSDEAHLQPSKGVHIIAPQRGHRAAALFLHPRDVRVFFVIPWYGKTLVGTTDTFSKPGDNPLKVDQEDIEYLLDGYNHYFDPGLNANDVMGAFAGLRPLLRARTGEPSSRSREYRLHASPSGLVTALGGKYTTFRRMAEAIVDLLAARLGKKRRSGTRELPLAGTPETAWPLFVDRTVSVIARRHSLPRDCAMHLVRRYGNQVESVAERINRVENGFARVHAEEPDVIGEQAWQREEEMAICAADYYLRRSRIGMWRPELLLSAQAPG